MMHISGFLDGACRYTSIVFFLKHICIIPVYPVFYMGSFCHIQPLQMVNGPHLEKRDPAVLLPLF